MRPHLASVLGTICPEGAHLTLPADLTGTRGAPISDPARFGVLLNTCRVGDRRSGGSVKKPDQNSIDACRAISSPIASEAVAAGLGAFRTCKARRRWTRQKSWTNAPSGDMA